LNFTLGFRLVLYLYFMIKFQALFGHLSVTRWFPSVLVIHCNGVSSELLVLKGLHWGFDRLLFVYLLLEVWTNNLCAMFQINCSLCPFRMICFCIKQPKNITTLLTHIGPKSYKKKSIFNFNLCIFLLPYVYIPILSAAVFLEFQIYVFMLLKPNIFEWTNELLTLTMSN
jgi:hypothetical protein